MENPVPDSAVPESPVPEDTGMAHFSRATSAKTTVSELLERKHSDIRKFFYQGDESICSDSDDENEAFLTQSKYTKLSAKSRPTSDRKPSSKLRVLADSPEESTDSTSSDDDDALNRMSRSSSPDYETDLETEIPPEPKLEEMEGIPLYEKLCERLGVVPLSCVRESMVKTHFNLPHRGIGPRGIEALAPPLCTNDSARNLNLENNMIGPDGCSYITSLISHNTVITELNLSFNKFGTEGITTLCRAIKDSDTLLHLDLSNNEFDDKDAHLFADIIENNIRLQYLNLSKNMFSIESGKILGPSLANNDTLETLDISWNALRLEGAQAFAKGLAANLGLKSLNLSMNGFSTDGTRAVGIALSLNKYLEHLDLSFNRISNNAAADFARYFKINCTLKTLKLYGNPIMYDAAQEILKTIGENERSAVCVLDLRGLMVHQEFVDLATQINAERPFKAEYGVVSHGKNLEATIDRFADMNPLEILLIFMGEQNLRLVDLFRSFDKDQSGGLTRDEFIVGLQEIKTPLSRSQLDELLDMLDKDGDGEIDLKEILNINREYRDIKMKANRYVQEEKLQKKLEKEGKKETELGAFTKEAMALKQRGATTVAATTEEFAGGQALPTGAISAPPTALGGEVKQLDGSEPTAEKTEKPTVTAEEAAELNEQVKTIKTKGALSMWKSKALV